MNKKLLAVITLVFAFQFANAHVGPNHLKKMKDKVELAGSRMDCQPAQSQIDMEINNVRARLLTGGDVWWNKDQGRYIVPKPAEGFPEVSALFAGGVWIGGVDPNGNLKLAGITYSEGNETDFYPGPLDEGGQTDLDVCEDWDEFFVVKGAEILKHISNYDAGQMPGGVEYACEDIPDEIKYWPGRGNPFFEEKYDFPIPDQNLGNFWDEDGDEVYNPCNGDFPVINIRDCEPENKKKARELLPDEMVFWVYNDNGGPHRLSNATAIQMEVQVQSFAYATNDEINDMTFYRYKLINKATDFIRDCYFAMWIDPDLGCFEDDYIGCDVERSMAYVYNEDASDGNPGTTCAQGIETYKNDIPILGMDYFRGPREPRIYRRDEDDNIIFDPLTGEPFLDTPEPGTGEQDTLVELGMTSFVYQNSGSNNEPEATTDPDQPEDFYNILRGLWKDGTPVTFGSSGYAPGSTDSIKYVFPDTPNDENGWSMCTAGLPFGDRRTVQATGPLLLQPGATNELILGVVFVPNIEYPCPNISRLQFADDLAQALFDNCFDITDGPDAPDMFAVELDRQLVLLLSNDSLEIESNNAKEEYAEVDINMIGTFEDSLYVFEGYKIYQLANPNVSVQELDNIDLARLIRQVDVKNEISEIFNWNSVPNPDGISPDVFFPERKIVGNNVGIQHSFNVLVDQFANTDRRLVNHKNYYYTVIAYGYNNYKQFNIFEAPGIPKGQSRSYLEGRRNVKTYTYTPRPVVYQELQSAYGQEAVVTRLQGVGTAFNALDLQDGTHDQIFDETIETTETGTNVLTYKSGNGPINPKIIDPLNIKNARYRLEVIGEFNDSKVNPRIELGEDEDGNLDPSRGARWRLTNIDTDQIIASEKSIEQINEQIVYGEGFSISVNQVGEPGTEFNDDNGAITQVYEYADANETNWFNAVPAVSGTEVVIDEVEDVSIFAFPFVNLNNDTDPDEALSSTDDGYFIPFRSTKWTENLEIEPNPYITPGWKGSLEFIINAKKLEYRFLNNVDIVFTSDKSKWSKCIVVEAAVPDYTNFGLATIGDANQFDLRQTPAIDKDGNPSGELDDEGELIMGMSYFPGYAIDVETGEQLNIFFGENSVYNTANDALLKEAIPNNPINTAIGDDLIWNPSTALFATGEPFRNFYNSTFAGGQHYVYVTRQEYDECAVLYDKLGSNALQNKINGASLVTWTGIPIPQEPLLPIEEGLIPNDLTVKLRVTNSFNKELDIEDAGGNFPQRFVGKGDLPVYEFGFEGVEAKDVQPDDYASALDNVQVVPNPYYAYSAYEQNQFQNIVKVTNLPPRAIVTIYSLDGKFIQQYNRDAMPIINDGLNPALTESQITPALEWNLTNNKGIPVASGVYIFHISAPDLGIEKSIKWFGVNRRFDPTGL